MENDPVDTTPFAGAEDSMTGAFIEKANVTEPTCHHTVTLTESIPLDPCRRLEITHVSDIQVTPEAVLDPWVIPRMFMFEKYPKYVPNEVIKTAPVTGVFDGVPAESTTGCK